jgi:hypothetical protein
LVFPTAVGDREAEGDNSPTTKNDTTLEEARRK